MNFPMQVHSMLLPPLEGSPWSLDFLARYRYQLIGAVVLAVLMPGLVQTALDGVRPRTASADSLIVGTFVAVVFGAYALRQLTAFAVVQRDLYVLPVFIVAYGFLAAGFTVLQIDYSRLQLTGSFLAALAWFYFVLHVEKPVRRPRLLVLRGGDAEGLTEIDGADWLIATEPAEVPRGITGVVADLRGDLGIEWERFLAQCALQGLPVYHSKQVRESLTGHVAIEHLSENNLGALLPSSVYMRFKRVFDLAGVLIAAPLALPLAASTAVLIKLFDGGPVLFRQTRMGFRGKPFSIYKFRTMAVGAEEGQHFTELDDPRISRLGRVLRR